MILLILAAILASLIYLVYYFIFIKYLRYWKNLGVKQTKPWPFLGDSGCLFFRRKSFCEFVEWMYNLHPTCRYFGFYQFTKPTLLIRDSQLIKQIAIKEFNHFTNRRIFVYPENDPLWGRNVGALTGQKWREMRATLTGCFTSSKMRNMFYSIEKAAENFVHFFLDKNQDIIEIDMKDAYTRYNNDVVALATLGIKCDSLANPTNEIYLIGKSVTNFQSIKVLLKFFGYMVITKYYKLIKISILDKDATTSLKNVINRTIKTREERNIVRLDMLNLLLKARRERQHKEDKVVKTKSASGKDLAYIGEFKQIRTITNADITSQALIFLFSSFETVSNAMCFGSYELAINKDIQDKLREEINKTYKQANGNLTYDILLSMKYMDMVVSELLRKWPPVPAVDRVCTKSYTIEPVTPDELPVPLKVGDALLFPIQGIHRDPANYPDPEKFDPERFSDENKVTIKPWTYMPFGMGPRTCIASRFTLLKIKALFFKLLLHFEIVPTQKTKIPIILYKSPLQHIAEGGFWFGLKSIKTQNDDNKML